MDAALTASSLLELELFAGLSPAEVAGFEGRLPVETHRRGTYLFRRGDVGDALYVVLDGQVALELPSGEGTRVLGLSGPGDWFGELALLTHGPRTADARITVDATLLRIARDTWAELSRRAPGLFARLCERLGSHLRARNEPVGGARRTVIACLEPSSGEASWVALESGPLLDGIRPSFAMPGIFPPCVVGERLLIDGAFSTNRWARSRKAASGSAASERSAGIGCEAITKSAPSARTGPPDE